MTSTVSVILSIHPGCIDPSVAIERILQQSNSDLELSVIDGRGVSAADCQPDALIDSRVRWYAAGEPRQNIRLRNEILEQSRSQWIAYVDADSLLPAHFLETALAQLRNSGAELAYTPGVSPCTDFDLAALCVADSALSGPIIHQRATVHETGGFDESLDARAPWELWLRMARRARPLALAALVDRSELLSTPVEQTTEDLVGEYVATARVHLRVRDLVDELPGTREAQWAHRQRLLTCIGESVDRRDSARMPSPRLCRGLIEMAYASMRFVDRGNDSRRDEDRRDLTATNRLFSRVIARGMADEALQRTQLHLLRTLEQPEQVIVAVGQIQDSSNPDVLRELGYALRQLGQSDDATAIESITDGLPGALPVVASDIAEIPFTSSTRLRAPGWPSWLPHGTAHAVTWVSAAHAYATVGLPSAARAALQRAIDAGHSPTDEDLALRHSVEMDRTLASMLSTAVAPLLPIRREDVSAPHVTVELCASTLADGPFNAILAEETLGVSSLRLLRRTLIDLLDPTTTYVDTVSTDEATALAVISSLASPCTYVAWRSDASAVRRFSAAVDRHGVASVGLATSDPDMLHQTIARAEGPIVMHIRFRDAATALVTGLIASVRAACRPLQIVWSDTAWPSVEHHPAFPSVEAIGRELGLTTVAIGETDGTVYRTTVSENPRAHVLLTC